MCALVTREIFFPDLQICRQFFSREAHSVATEHADLFLGNCNDLNLIRTRIFFRYSSGQDLPKGGRRTSQRRRSFNLPLLRLTLCRSKLYFLDHCTVCECIGNLLNEIGRIIYVVSFAISRLLMENSLPSSETSEGAGKASEATQRSLEPAGRRG